MTALRRLLRSRSGVAMTEFALGAPLVLMAGLWGTETANYALTSMKLGQVAVQVADNASRVGDLSTLQNRKVYESDINDVLYGAQLQAGGLKLFQYGRVIISSLQVRAAAARANNISSGNAAAGPSRSIPAMESRTRTWPTESARSARRSWPRTTMR